MSYSDSPYIFLRISGNQIFFFAEGLCLVHQSRADGTVKVPLLQPSEVNGRIITHEL